jgi:ubiquinone biosynthesis protein COQ9
MIGGCAAAPERSVERDEALALALPHVPALGWGWRAVEEGLRGAGRDEGARLEAELLFPGGAVDMVEAFIDRADRAMEAIAAGPDFAGLRTTGKVKALVLGRLALLAPHREAVRRALGVLAMPLHARVAAGSLARTVDAVWVLAGDTATDFNRYTKRALLAGVYSATLLYWLREEDEGAVAAFLDRRLAGVGRIGKLRGRIEGAVAGVRERLRPAA